MCFDFKDMQVLSVVKKAIVFFLQIVVDSFGHLLHLANAVRNIFGVNVNSGWAWEVVVVDDESLRFVEGP